MKILYGVENYYKNITFDVLTKCRDASNKDIISIPALDCQRVGLFGDHLPNTVKHISMVIENNESIQINQNFIQQCYQNKTVKILHLVLLSDDIYYNQMYDITRDLYKKFSPKVKTIYYKYSNTENFHNPYLKDDILYIHGIESRTPGILEKTIKALDYVKDKEYDYLVRSNISTIINFKLLEQKLIDTAPDYASSIILNLNWDDGIDGIVKSKHYGTNFASGTSMIFSKSMVHLILTYQKELDYTIMDDVSIAVLIKNKFPEITPVQLGYIVNVNQVLNLELDSIIFYRNRNEDRAVDIENMKFIITQLSRD